MTMRSGALSKSLKQQRVFRVPGFHRAIDIRDHIAIYRVAETRKHSVISFQAWSCFLSALASLGASPAAIDGVCVTLGAIFHLARADATPGAAARAAFVRGAHAAHAAALLGTVVCKR